MKENNSEWCIGHFEALRCSNNQQTHHPIGTYSCLPIQQLTLWCKQQQRHSIHLKGAPDTFAQLLPLVTNYTELLLVFSHDTQYILCTQSSTSGKWKRTYHRSRRHVSPTCQCENRSLSCPTSHQLVSVECPCQSTVACTRPLLCNQRMTSIFSYHCLTSKT